jgi:hypothetical protein
VVGVDDVEYLEEGVLDVPDILHRDITIIVLSIVPKLHNSESLLRGRINMIPLMIRHSALEKSSLKT